ncbi:hypothetical protein CLAFUW4_07757 [Fulvia fulva]|uniref:Alcohol dehydrogenase n=1 Tax=Passalora fulva TaxID=5499 RepID=A0A9Q8LDK4_PASFU|nr:Alcohol dehydrogenase [Fulvia fulva]KAK4629057.1 hypothetical protein CLAFUR4_07762 [Fulvia fulva]KAK4630106.1 hypothetical protein CLAFUR0_07760 [Fulvia fulva]UJO15424.1 Alcohol dehydrogenase [Fulvia fulva]WPV12447.1 hypothetical protein CLAFUW4_07757 [Fulvia fulva]WPV27542.1 hypothetical protein CLAFUW7_07758 [Fulvia fulva]
MATNGTLDGSLPESQKAAQFNPVDKTVALNTIPIPTIKPDQILVKIKAASLCHRDLMLFEPNEQGLVIGEVEPFTMGHEACGTIVESGNEVHGFEKGDNISWLPIVDCCYDCDACQIQPLYCELGTANVQGMSVNGFFQEYAAIHWRNAAKIPDGMDLTTLSPMSCAGCTAFNSVTETIAELKGDPSETWVAVVGCGGLGHLGIQYLKAFGYKIIAVDISADALEEAKAQGADHVFNSKSDTDYIQRARELTGGKGCHAAINYTNPAPAYLATQQLIRYGGTLMVTGIPQKPLQFNAIDVSMNRIRIKGSHIGVKPGLEKCLGFSHKHGIKPHVTKFKLDEFPKMLEPMQMNQHKGRMAVVFD